MRRRKHKSLSRIVRFYKVNYGFREPYKVFLDGNFIHNVVQVGQGTLQEQVERVLGARARLFTTRCVMAEMATMGPEVSGSLAAARALALAKCGHEDAPQPASGCLRSLVGSDNREHYWIATQDRDLRRALSEIPGTPSLFLTAHGLTIEAPSEVDKKSVEQVQHASRHVAEHERGNELVREALGVRQHKGAGKVRKKAKGPNPLACKKKSPKQQQRREANAEGAAKRRRKRKGGDKGDAQQG